MVIVDSDVWSEAFRRKPDSWSPQVKRLQELIDKEEILMIGPIRQEVLSGLREGKRYDAIRKALRSWLDEPLKTEVFEMAASFYNLCRSKGVQGSHTDFLICSCAVSWDAEILSKDNDYKQYAKHIPIQLCERL